jgi:hypothetical protein
MSVLLLLLLGFICEGALGYGWVSVSSFLFILLVVPFCPPTTFHPAKALNCCGY